MPYRDKNEQKEYSRKYYLENKEKYIEYARKQYAKNKEKIKERNRQQYTEKREELKKQSRNYYNLNKTEISKKQKNWHLKNKDIIRKIQKRYRKKHRVEIKKYNKSYNLKNRKEKNQYRNEWRKNNPDKVKAEKLKVRFKITLKEYNDLIIKQKNKCGICGNVFNFEKRNSMQYPCIDHSHKNNKIRGILCRKCNSGLGGFKDNIKIINQAIKWLKGKIDFKNSKNSNINIHKRYDLKRIYNINQEQFIKLLSRQNNQCGICNTILDSKKSGMNIDHCHETNKIRGILCRKCNLSLGLFNDDIKLLKNALKWLRKDTNHENGSSNTRF